MLILPIGPPGCGKSTIGAKLVLQGVLSPQSIISPDFFREWVSDGNRADQDSNYLVFKIARSLAEERLSRGLDVYFDATNVKAKDLKANIELAFLANQPVLLLVSQLSEGSIRIHNKQRIWAVPEHVMDRMIQAWKSLDLDRYKDDPRITIGDLGDYDYIAKTIKGTSEEII